jgi:hypothetical protein
MSETIGLLNQRVKIVLRRFHPETPREIIRGIITEVDESGVRVSGRRFQDYVPKAAGLPEERPVERTNKIYWVPFNSIRYSEVIPAGSLSEKADTDVQRRKPLEPAQVYGKSALE